jgi:alkanesulfonate monooxygenase SsuD/methylene tetrahydromethanopterin reductase-like flavin-dependent oxidoreductase (luciferase family)
MSNGNLTLSLHVGVVLSPQHTPWEPLRDAAVVADRLGFDSIWTWDHLVPVRGDPAGPIFEAWQVLAGFAGVTARARLGTLVSPATFRHPAIVAKTAATLDHVSGGRVILGIGAGWHVTEHDSFALPLGAPGERLARLSEFARVLQLLGGAEYVDFRGRYFRLSHARAEPHALQARIPLLIGGGGDRMAQLVARYADLWHVYGSPAVVAGRVARLREACAEIGRDPAQLTVVSGLEPRAVIRPTRAQAFAWLERVQQTQGIVDSFDARCITTPEEVIDLMVAYWDAGVRGLLIGFAPPYDLETMTQIATRVLPEVRVRIAHRPPVANAASPR